MLPPKTLRELLLFNRAETILLNNNVPSFLQHAGRPPLGAIDSVADLLALLRSTPKAHLLAIDLSKAFDRVPRNVLFAKLYNKGIRGKLWRAIFSTYQQCTSQITIGAFLSKVFSLPNGIKQGSVLSTLLYILLVEDLLQDLDQKQT
jgi:fermentation-respiration switch protein FrsA (DUF1100 family)